MLEEIIGVVIWLVIAEVLYFKVALKYDFLVFAREEIKIKGKLKKAYGLDGAFGYKILSLFFSGMICFALYEFFQDLIQNIVTASIIAAVIGAVVLFFWGNWKLTKRRQGNQIPEKRVRDLF